MKTATIKTWLMPALLTLCMVLSMVPVSAHAADSTVRNASELEAALENADCAEIKLGGNIETTWKLDVERTVTLDLNGYTLSCSSTDEDMIRVLSSGNLTVKDSGTGGSIDGQNRNCGFNVKGGTLTLESGSIVNCTDADGDGGAVDVANTGTAETPTKYGKFIMNGGAIMDCKAGDDGGAVDIGSGCTFVMNGGTIGNCRADDDGGAVHIKQSGTFELNGGIIQDCSSGANGGAVNIYQDGRFTMNGGTIKDCKADLGGYGNAVYGKDDKAIVVISGGTIEGCGVHPWSFDEFTVTFDSDGGSAVTEQKVLNSPAIKPADPKKDGYDFAGWYLGEEEYTFTDNVTRNITLKAHWTPVAAPATIVEEIRLDGAVISFDADDKPRFSGGISDSHVDLDHERWDANDGSGYGITSSDYWNERYDGKLITKFEDGKSYTYSVYFKISDPGMKEGCHFDKNTKLFINGKEITLTPAQIDVDDSGETIWFKNVLTMTPEVSATKPEKPGEENTTPDKPDQSDTKSSKTGDNSNMILWLALLVISGGAVVGTTVVSRKKKYNR